MAAIAVDIRSLRQRRKLTQAGLGGLVGVHACTVGRWERGVHRPRQAHADRLLALDRDAKPIGSRLHDGRRSASAKLKIPATIGDAKPMPPIASGDNWIMHCGDLFDVVPTLDDNSVDGLICDLPYSSGGLHIGTKQQSPQRKYGGRAKYKHSDFDGDSRDQIAFMAWAAEVLRRCYRVVKPGGVIAVFSDYRQADAFKSAIQFAGFAVRGLAIWDKGEGARPQPSVFRNQCELIWWGSKGRLSAQRGCNVLPGVVRQPVRTSDKHHLTGKPTPVMRWLAKFVIPGGLILDPTAGSGSTGVGALLEGRRFVGIEQDRGNCTIAAKRLEAAAVGQILCSAQTRDLPTIGLGV